MTEKAKTPKKRPVEPLVKRRRRGDEEGPWTREDFLRDLDRATRRVEESGKERA